MPHNNSPECDRCWYYAGRPQIHCIYHPKGIQESHCPSFEPDPEVEVFQGLGWVSEEPGYYAGEQIEQPLPRWSEAERLELLDWHPIFTGCCPKCERPIDPPDPPIHWDCPHCGWVDDSV